jgi:uncharacterized protein YdeI (BOF family)
MTVKFQGGEARRKFQSLVKQWADDDLSERADRIVAQAKTPGFGFTDRSGKLRGSIHKKKIAQPRVAGYRIVAGEGALGNDGKSYAAAVEKGFVFLTKDKKTGKPKIVSVDPHPYLNPALQAGKD